MDCLLKQGRCVCVGGGGGGALVDEVPLYKALSICYNEKDDGK